MSVALVWRVTILVIGIKEAMSTARKEVDEEVAKQLK